ncbi:MAG: hypothetical protein KA072_06085 [Thermoanaerobaculaceae bacterium]|nr:hypothetical protein [Thermoanaerobaculaceae bacterium]MDI9622041.1 quinol:cytochrome C oxidoreductase [Acidobacteriota bacterium]NLH09762.1 quinol:cytochrome C oxidoreductase [Holophagae bacterium]HPW54831.1 hypothetical protein [Thermoanaerobaculaceae bacterium]
MSIPDIFQEERRLGVGAERLGRMAAGVGVAAIAASLVLAAVTAGGVRRLAFAYLTSYAWALSLALGALFFVILQHLTRAGWSVVVRRLAEGVAATLPYWAALVLPVLVSMGVLYRWSHGDVVAADVLLQAKSAYLNVPFFVVRLTVYFLVWLLLTRFFVGRSRAQDASGDPAVSLLLQRRAAPAMIAFALTITFASFDLLMSLDPHWFSTVFGVYYFAGSIVGVVALLTVMALVLQRSGLLRHAITVEHYHDLGKLLFAFTVFWAYIAFSQYMLCWYAALPEETGWFVRRQTHGWGVVGLVLVLGHFLLPFLALLSRTPKRTPRLLAVAAGWMLLMHWVDLYWLVVPEVSREDAVPRLVDMTVFVAVAALGTAFVIWALRRHSLVPERDPRLAESLAFENA